MSGDNNRYQVLLDTVPMYARLNAVELSEDESKSRFTRFAKNLPKPIPVYIQKTPANKLNVVCLHPDCDGGNEDFATRARMNNFYKYHDHWGKAIQKEKRGRRIIFGDHLMVVGQFVTEGGQVICEERFVETDTLEYLSANVNEEEQKEDVPDIQLDVKVNDEDVFVCFIYIHCVYMYYNEY